MLNRQQLILRRIERDRKFWIFAIFVAASIILGCTIDVLLLPSGADASAYIVPILGGFLGAMVSPAITFWLPANILDYCEDRRAAVQVAPAPAADQRIDINHVLARHLEQFAAERYAEAKGVINEMKAQAAGRAEPAHPVEPEEALEGINLEQPELNPEEVNFEEQQAQPANLPNQPVQDAQENYYSSSYPGAWAQDLAALPAHDADAAAVAAPVVNEGNGGSQVEGSASLPAVSPAAPAGALHMSPRSANFYTPPPARPEDSKGLTSPQSRFSLAG